MSRNPTRIVSAFLAVLFLAACAPHTPAPVVTRESPAPVFAQKATTAKMHRVSKGDTLISIAWRYGLDYHKLATWNGIRSPYRIYPGQKLSLFPRSKPRPVKRTSKPKKKKPVETARTRPQARKAVVAKPEKVEKAPKVAHKTAITEKDVAKPVVRKRTGPLKWTWPTRGKVVKTFRKGDKTRQGLRISGRLGQPIVAAESGTVVYSGSGLPGYGKLIIIKHNKNYLSAYGFNRKLLVKDGETVERGTRIAEMGRSKSGKSQLHFEIRRSDSVLNPSRLLPKR